MRMIVCLLALMFATSAHAQTTLLGGAAVPGAQGHSQDYPGTPATTYMFVNWMKYASVAVAAGLYDYPRYLDSNGYPTHTYTGASNKRITYTTSFPLEYTGSASYKWILIWTGVMGTSATTPGAFTGTNNGSGYTSVASTFNGVTYMTGVFGTNAGAYISQANGRISWYTTAQTGTFTLNFANSTDVSGAGYTNPGTLSNWTLIRADRESALFQGSITGNADGKTSTLSVSSICAAGGGSTCAAYLNTVNGSINVGDNIIGPEGDNTYTGTNPGVATHAIPPGCHILSNAGGTGGTGNYTLDCYISNMTSTYWMSTYPTLEQDSIAFLQYMRPGTLRMANYIFYQHADGKSPYYASEATNTWTASFYPPGALAGGHATNGAISSGTADAGSGSMSCTTTAVSSPATGVTYCANNEDDYNNSAVGNNVFSNSSPYSDSEVVIGVPQDASLATQTIYGFIDDGSGAGCYTGNTGNVFTALNANAGNVQIGMAPSIQGQWQSLSSVAEGWLTPVVSAITTTWASATTGTCGQYAQFTLTNSAGTYVNRNVASQANVSGTGQDQWNFTPTMNVGGRGAVPLYVWTGPGNYFQSYGAGELPASGVQYFVYDKWAHAFVYAQQGYPTAVPTTVIAQICNKVQANCWLTLPTFLDDFSIQQITSSINANLSQSLTPLFEVIDEVGTGYTIGAGLQRRQAATGFPDIANMNNQYAYEMSRIGHVSNNTRTTVWAGFNPIWCCGWTTYLNERLLGSSTTDTNGYYTTGSISGVTFHGQIAVGTGNTPSYSAGTTYSQGQMALYGGSVYMSLVNSNTGNTPSGTRGTDWQLVGFISTQSTVSVVAPSGTIGPGFLTGTGVPRGTMITQQITGTSGDACPAVDCNGGTGSYGVNGRIAVPATAMTLNAGSVAQNWTTVGNRPIDYVTFLGNNTYHGGAYTVGSQEGTIPGCGWTSLNNPCQMLLAMPPSTYTTSPSSNTIAASGTMTFTIPSGLTAAAYNAGTTYSSGQVVSLGSINYTSLQNSNMGHTPAAGSAFWQQNGYTSFTVGDSIMVYAANHPANFMTGTVASYSGTSLTMTANAKSGSGTFTSWILADESAYTAGGSAYGPQIQSIGTNGTISAYAICTSGWNNGTRIFFPSTTMTTTQLRRAWGTIDNLSCGNNTTTPDTFNIRYVSNYVFSKILVNNTGSTTGGIPNNYVYWTATFATGAVPANGTMIKLYTDGGTDGGVNSYGPLPGILPANICYVQEECVGYTPGGQEYYLVANVSGNNFQLCSDLTNSTCGVAGAGIVSFTSSPNVYSTPPVIYAGGVLSDGDLTSGLTACSAPNCGTIAVVPFPCVLGGTGNGCDYGYLDAMDDYATGTKSTAITWMANQQLASNGFWAGGAGYFEGLTYGVQRTDSSLASNGAASTGGTITDVVTSFSTALQSWLTTNSISKQPYYISYEGGHTTFPFTSNIAHVLWLDPRYPNEATLLQTGYRNSNSANYPTASFQSVETTMFNNLRGLPMFGNTNAGLSQTADIDIIGGLMSDWSQTEGTLYNNLQGTNFLSSHCPSQLNTGQYCFANPFGNFYAYSTYNRMP